MKWINFLHFYQPANQQEDILEAIVNQSYRPIFTKLSEVNGLNISINISGSLLELLDKYGYSDLIDCLRKAVKDSKIELTGSCKYHALLPLIPEKEAIRQIEMNEETLKFYFGNDFRPKGFFPPEMAYDPKLSKIIEELRYEWVVLDEIALPGNIALNSLSDNSLDFTTKNLFKIKDTDLKVFFRDRRVSNMIMSAIVRDVEGLKEAVKIDSSSDGYFVTAMDGETFGHHRVGHEKFLFEMLEDTSLEISSVSKFLSEYENKLSVKEVVPTASTWASSPQNIQEGSQFLSWLDKDNLIHKYQWEFVSMALGLLDKCDVEVSVEARKKMDIALASDHLWWASAKPWWSLEMIEDGAFKLLDVIRSLPEVSQQDLHKASDLYQKILSTAFEWQRTGKIREMAKQQHDIMRIPFKDRTIGKGGAEEAVYSAFVNTMKEEEKKASDKGDYEKATLWRDAIYKLDKKLDIYDTVNAVDLLRKDIGNEEVEKIIKKYKEEYLRIRGGQPEQRGN